MPEQTTTSEVTAIPAPPEKRTPARMTNQDMQAMIEILPPEEREQHVREWFKLERERQTFENDQRLARVLALSGEFNDLRDKTPEQAFAAMVAKFVFGRSIGLEPGDAARYVYFTNGRPSVENDVVASKLAEAGYAWDTDWQWEEITHKNKPWKKCTGVTLWLKKWSQEKRAYVPVLDRQGNPVSESFTEADADHATIWEKGKQITLSEKFNYKSFPRDMYFWRAISRIRKYHVPHVLRGSVVRAEVMDVTPQEAAQMAAQDSPETPETPPPVARTVRDIVMNQESFLPPEEKKDDAPRT